MCDEHLALLEKLLTAEGKFEESVAGTAKTNTVIGTVRHLPGLAGMGTEDRDLPGTLIGIDLLSNFLLPKRPSKRTLE